MGGAKMREEFRKTGINFVGDLPWGSHLCQFYQNKEDLIKILVPYLKAGLENNEFCMWVCSEPLKVEGAKAALKNAVENLDDYIENGQIEILDYTDCYIKSGKLDTDRALQGWVEKESQALKTGFEGFRLTGNTFWLEKKDWRSFTEYERVVNDVIGKYRMLAICTYYLDKCGPYEAIDVISSHQFALIRRKSKWELMEIAERRRAEERMKTLATIVDQAKVPIATVDMDGIIATWNRSCEEMLGYSAEETVGKIPLSKICPGAAEQIQATLREGYCLDRELESLTKDGRVIPCSTSTFLLRDEAGDLLGVGGIVIDITQRKKTEKKSEAYQKRLRSLASQLTFLEERERRHIVTELRNSIDQLLAASKIKLEELKKVKGPLDSRRLLKDTSSLLDKIIHHTRSLTLQVGPPILYELGLVEALEWLAEKMYKQHGIQIYFEIDSEAKVENEELRTFLFRAVWELLMNVARHAKTERAKVSLHKEGASLRISVEDRGVGFNLPALEGPSDKNRRFGLFSIRECFSYFEGEFSIQSEPGHGTQALLTVPLKEAQRKKSV